MKHHIIALPFALALGLVACGSDSTSTVAGADTASTVAGGDTASTVAGGDTTQDSVATTLPDGPLGGGTGAIGTVEITVTHPDIEPIVYTVGCMGDTFPVTPQVEGVVGQQACELLADEAIATRLIDGIPEDQVCTEIYGGPDEAHIVGEVDGVAIDATITRVNGCEIAAWESMLGLLPPAIGAT
ncbi:MAG: hypothetical protein R2710_26500 [Acidimicrobiales bacterium]